MGAGASKPPVSGHSPTGIAFRRKLEEIRRRRKVRAFRDSIVSTTELLKDRADLESLGEAARLSAVGLDADSPDPKNSLAVDVPGPDQADGSVEGPKLETDAKPEAAKSEKPEAVEAAKSESHDEVGTRSGSGQTAGKLSETGEEAKPSETGEAAKPKLIPVEEKREAEEKTKKTEAIDEVTSLADQVALLKCDDEIEQGSEMEEEDKEEGRELGFVDLPGSPSFRYFAMINNNSAADSDDSDDSAGERAHDKDDDDDEEGNGEGPSKEGAVNEGEESLLRKKKKRRGMIFRARSLAKGPVAVCTLLHVNSCYCAPQDSPNRSPRRRASLKHSLIDHDKEKSSSDDQPPIDKAAGEKPTAIQTSIA